jgi:hypothetical protein
MRQADMVACAAAGQTKADWAMRDTPIRASIGEASTRALSHQAMVAGLLLFPDRL